MGRYATDAVGQYVSEHDGEWPSSWSDLEPYLADKRFLESISKAIAIDFHSDPGRLARQPLDSFTAIRPARDCSQNENGLKEYWGVPHLQSLLKRYPVGH
jgi:hypothetical protein